MIGALGRRALITRLAGMAAASAVITPKAVLDAAKAGDLSADLQASDGSVAGGMCQPVADHAWRIVDEMRERHYDQFVNRHMGMHHSVASKRSWSPAYKAHVHAEMQRDLRAAALLLQRNERLAARVARAFGIGL